MLKSKVVKKDKNKRVFGKFNMRLFIVVFVIAMLATTGDSNKEINTESVSKQENEIETEVEANTSQIDDVPFVIMDVRNDMTGNWRIALIAENIEIHDYALDYYKEYFESDEEIHAIVNFNYKTTTKISVVGDLLNVSVYEYVDKEEHDSNLLFSGMLLKEIWLDKNTGKQIEFK